MENHPVGGQLMGSWGSGTERSRCDAFLDILIDHDSSARDWTLSRAPFPILMSMPTEPTDRASVSGGASEDENQVLSRPEGATPAEKYLAFLCENTFLSLWSYPSTFRNQGLKNGGHGKEVCDLLVVFENDIVIFSDKQGSFPRTGDTRQDWCRWFKKAILASANQIFGAERWIAKFPDQLFLDRACTQRFPIALPDPNKVCFHRIVVAHDVIEACREQLGAAEASQFVPISSERCITKTATSLCSHLPSG
jgi:hypothetical protein